jgi:hypothetical protein
VPRRGQPGLAASLVTEDFRIWFGSSASADVDLAGPDGLAAYVTRHRATRPGLAFGKHRDLIIDTGRQRAAFTWSASIGERSVGGIDVLQFDAGRIDGAWPVTGQRPLTC